MLRVTYTAKRRPEKSDKQQAAHGSGRNPQLRDKNGDAREYCDYAQGCLVEDLCGSSPCANAARYGNDQEDRRNDENGG